MDNDLLLTNKNSRILTYSQRNLKMHAAWACLYEFQDLLADIDSVDYFIPIENYERSKQFFKWVKRFSRSPSLGDLLRPKPNSITLNRDYDLFYVLLANPFECIAINSLKNWRQRAKFSVCHLVEIWEKDIPKLEAILKYFYKYFDHIFVGHFYGLEKISEITGCSCSYLPITIDALKFCPDPKGQLRPIDVFSLGRRSEVTHKAMFDFAQQQNLWYLYDTLKVFDIKDYTEHRSLIASQLKRSRYLFANRARADRPDVRGDQSEIGYRFFEGAAAGTIMLGDYPDTDIYHQYFDWPDATIRMPFDNPNIGEMIKELDTQPERLARIRRDNVVNSLLKFDYVYSWEKILNVAGLSPHSKLLKRKEKLKEMAELIKKGSLAP